MNILHELRRCRWHRVLALHEDRRAFRAAARAYHLQRLASARWYFALADYHRRRATAHGWAAFCWTWMGITAMLFALITV